jgi:hypothetical protein
VILVCTVAFADVPRRKYLQCKLTCEHLFFTVTCVSLSHDGCWQKLGFSLVVVLVLPPLLFLLLSTVQLRAMSVALYISVSSLPPLHIISNYCSPIMWLPATRVDLLERTKFWYYLLLVVNFWVLIFVDLSRIWVGLCYSNFEILNYLENLHSNWKNSSVI